MKKNYNHPTIEIMNICMLNTLCESGGNIKNGGDPWNDAHAPRKRTDVF
jgi:hypothetical protein